MAKRFGGFTPQQQQQLLSPLGYTGPAQQDDMNKFMMSSPQAASMMGKYASMAKARVEGGPQMAMQVGGYMAPPTPMQQLQQQAAILDYNKLYNMPGQPQQMQELLGYQVGGVVDDEQDMTNNQQQGMVGTMGGTDGDLGTAYGTDGNVGTTSTEEQPNLYSGSITNNTLEDILKMSTGSVPADLQYDFNGDGKITSADALQAGKIGEGQGTIAEGTDEGGVYDPSQGLPDPVGNLYTDANKAYEDAFQTDFNAGTEGTNKNVEQDKSWAKTTVEQMANVADPKDYTLGTYVAENGKTYLQLEYPDGTVIPTGHRKQKYAIGRANILAAATNASKNVVTPEEKTALEQQYQDQLSVYEQYQTEQATSKAETPVAETIETAQNQVNVSTNLIAQYNKELAGLDVDDPKRTVIEKYIADEQLKLNQANADLTQAKDRQSAEKLQETKERTEALEADPSSAVTKADVSTISDTAKEAGKIGEGVGSAGEAEQATVTSVGDTGQATVPTAKDAATYTAEETQAAVKETLDALVAATGKPSNDALAEAQTMNAEELAQLGLTAAQIEEAVQVTAPDKRVAEEGELLDVDEDVTVDMERVEKEALNFEAATGTPSTEATVQGQLTGLMADFEGGEPPAWAAGAMRAATQQMAARGLAASSMAAQAIVQAAMESALPIAMQDAQTVASFEAQNLSNRQQVAMFAAEQRAKFLGMEFDQGFQIRVQNAAKIADIANQNFSAEVQISLENARLANTVDLTNLDAKSAKILADAAAMSNVDLANLNNRQQAAVQIANSFLQFDMAEFDAKQQVAIFKAEGNIQSILSDQAAVNAAEQFNATSENQTNQFYDSLISQVEQFNVDQDNAMKKFEAEQANALAMFNTEQENKRAEFEATNALLIAQADAKWEQDIALTDTAATNEANNNEAKATNDMTKTVYEAAKLAERDMASYSFQTENNNADRATSVAIQVMQNEASADSAAASKSAAFATAAGAVIAKII